MSINVKLKNSDLFFQVCHSLYENMTYDAWELSIFDNAALKLSAKSVSSYNSYFKLAS